MSVAFNRPFLAGRELEYIAEAVRLSQLAGDGTFTRRCQQWMEQRFGVRKVLLTHSCTGALEMAAMLAGVGPGDEVILPSYTFTSTATAFHLRGATLRFAEIDPETLNVASESVRQLLTSRTRVIVPVHYAGVGCDMDRICALAATQGCLVVEDAAQGFSARYRGRFLGTIGQLGTFSFHETKNVISGEGGAMLINEPAFAERAEIIWQKGTNRKRFERGEVDKYTWVDMGSSYPPSELVAAFLYAQLEQADAILRQRLSLHDRYRDALSGLETRGCVRLPYVPPECEHNAHMFYLLAASADERSRLLAHLRAQGIHAIFHYVPLHISPMGRAMGYAPGDLPVTEDLAARIVRLPMFHSLSNGEQSEVIAAVKGFYA